MGFVSFCAFIPFLFSFPGFSHISPFPPSQKQRTTLAKKEAFFYFVEKSNIIMLSLNYLYSAITCDFWPTDLSDEKAVLYLLG